ncbi:DNA phosphorothioation system sulfurtransferase DndC [Nitrosomonas sp.]|uniref:DNA phosphorothioation system sulfurtransferase DndC n=1 Tax=Nitrosomonas sp. TaxID=42353 RepID=UPI003305D8CB
MIQDILDNLLHLYSIDTRPWIVGYSGGKDSTMIASLVFEAVITLPPDLRKKEICIVCTDTRVEIPAIVNRVQNELDHMNICSKEHCLNITAHLLKPPAQQSFWVNIIGRGYPPPNRNFRWCTQRLKIDPVSEFIRNKLGHWGEAIIILGARRNESGSRAQTLDARAKNEFGLRRHDDLPRCWISTPIEHLSTFDVWDYLIERPCPWGGDNLTLFQLYKKASGGECPLVVDQSTPSCGNSRFGCWTCTVVERDKASEGLLATGDQRMEALLHFRDTLMHYRDPENGFRDMVRKNGQEGPGPLKIEARKELLSKLLALQEESDLPVISEEELHWIQTYWNSARNPDDGTGVVNIIFQQKGDTMPDSRDDAELRDIEQRVASEKEISLETLRRLIAKVEEYGESHRAVGLPDELLQILQDDLRERQIEKGEVYA